LSNKTCD